MAAVAVLAASVLHLGQAEARRFGGGGSFGYHRLIPHSSSGAYGSRSLFGPRTGGMPRRGIMGAIAGLAFGGLLGSLLFGSAFHGIDVFDILILGGILLLILNLVRRKGSMAYAAQPFSGMQGMQAPPRGFTATTNDPSGPLPTGKASWARPNRPSCACRPPGTPRTSPTSVASAPPRSPRASRRTSDPWATSGR
jgi:hypothetical protein